MLHFHGFASEWQPLCRKYNVWSGNPIPQKTHCNPDKDRLPFNLHKEESEGCSVAVEVIVPFVVVAASLGELSALLFGDEVARLDKLLLVTIFLFKSSRRRLFSGETFMFNELKLEHVADWTLPEGDVLKLIGPLRFELSNSSFGSCLIGINEIDGVMLVSWSIRKEFVWIWVLDGAFELESADCGDNGHSPFILCEASPDWPGWEFERCGSHWKKYENGIVVFL